MRFQNDRMSIRAAGPLLWIFLACSIFLENGVADTFVQSSNNSTVNDSLLQKTLVRRLPTPWRKGKLPLRPPRLRNHQKFTTASELVTSSTTNAPTTHLPPTTTLDDTQQRKEFLDESSYSIRRRVDVIEPSSSEQHHRSVIWPVRQRPAIGAKRFRAPTPTTPTPQVLLKLFQPKPTRPAIYSLDGFVPKPSLTKIASTTEPPFLYSKNDLQLLPSVVRRRKVNRINKNGDDEDYDDELSRKKKPVSRYTAFARKGIPGEDYPVFGFIPHTDFQCREQPGLYADPFTNCQVWHMCPGGNMAPRHSFLCPNGTIFNQKKGICDWWYNVGCRKNRNIRSLILLDNIFTEKLDDKDELEMNFNIFA